MKKSLKDLGYCIGEKGTTTFIYSSSRPELPSLIENAKDAHSTHPDLSGRVQIRIIEPDLVVRTLTHGGILRHITGERFLSPARSLRELEISSYLIANNIPTPEILALVLKRTGFFYHIRVIPGRHKSCRVPAERPYANTILYSAHRHTYPPTQFF